jgi:hypothetical protein
MGHKIIVGWEQNITLGLIIKTVGSFNIAKAERTSGHYSVTFRFFSHSHNIYNNLILLITVQFFPAC